MLSVGFHDNWDGFDITFEYDIQVENITIPPITSIAIDCSSILTEETIELLGSPPSCEIPKDALNVLRVYLGFMH